MLLSDALTRLDTIENVIKTANKGLFGLNAEVSIGLSNTSNLLDFEDGEFKTFSKKETIAITMIDLNDIFSKDFDNSKLYKKIHNVLFLCRETKKHKVISLKKDDILYKELKSQYEFIKKQLKELIDDGKLLTTINGVVGLNRIGKDDLIQIRNKDTKGSQGLLYNGVKVSNKRRAFYFTKNFTRKYLHETII